MNRLFGVFWVFVAMLFVSSICDAVEQYTIVQLTNNSYSDTYPQINDNGYVVWRAPVGVDDEIFLYDGSTITQLTDNSYDDRGPKINDDGYVVWYGGEEDTEIFLYDGSTVIQLTDNSYDDLVPKINNDGYVVWYGELDIFLYDGSSTIQLNGEYSGIDPQINDNGYVVWHGGDSYEDTEIFLYDGSSTIQLTKNSYDDRNPRINNGGQVAWDGDNDGLDSEIFLYDGSSVTQVTNNAYQDTYPEISDNGYVVWTGSDGSHLQVYLFNGSSIIQLTHDNYNVVYCNINDNGYVVWYSPDGSDHEIFMYDGLSTTQLTDNSHQDWEPQINNRGYVTWYGKALSLSEIFIACPDSDEDGICDDEETASCECKLVPDRTVLSRGGAFGFEAIITNNTDQEQAVGFATKMTLPSGNMHPSSGYLFGPWGITLSPHDSLTTHRSDIIPVGAPLGIYAYHAAVAAGGVGILDVCEFDFEVSATGEPLATCDINPDSTEITAGGTLGYTVTLINTNDQEQNFAAIIQAWNGQGTKLLHEVSGRVSLAGSETSQYDLSLGIPLTLPPDDYLLKVIVGTDWSEVWSRDECLFSVIE